MAQSLKHHLAGKKTGNSPVDRSKKGTKRSLLTEAKGIPVGIDVDGANRHDVKLFGSTVESIIIDRPQPTNQSPQGMCLDAGYVGDEVQALGNEFGFTLHVRPRGEEARDIKKRVGEKARRWVVERTHSWMNRFRGLLIRWSKKSENYLGLLHLACGIITWRATGLLG
jgi:putative transposase